MPKRADPQEEQAHEGKLTRMAFLSCSASALSWSSSFILAKCVDGWRRLRQGHGIVVRPSPGPLHRPMLDHPRLPLPPRSQPPTDPQASADRPSNGPTGLLNLLQPAAYRRFFSSFTSSQSLALLQPGLFRSTSPAFSSSSWSSSALLAAATLLSWRARSRQTRAKGRGWHRRQRRRRRARRRRQLT